MKSLKSPSKMWALIGAAGTVVIVALGWVLLISGEKSRQSNLENQTASAQLQTATDHHKIALLQADNKKLPQYKKQLAALRTALPLDDATAQFAGDITNLSNQYNVQVTSTSFAPSTSSAQTTTPPASDTGSGDSGGSTPSDSGTGSETAGTTAAPVAPTVSQLQVTVAATGSLVNLRAFLKAMQHTEPRALVVTAASESAPLSSGGTASAPTLSLTMTAFVGTS